MCKNTTNATRPKTNNYKHKIKIKLCLHLTYKARYLSMCALNHHYYTYILKSVHHNILIMLVNSQQNITYF